MDNSTKLAWIPVRLDNAVVNIFSLAVKHTQVEISIAEARYFYVSYLNTSK